MRDFYSVLKLILQEHQWLRSVPPSTQGILNSESKTWRRCTSEHLQELCNVKQKF